MDTATSNQFITGIRGYSHDGAGVGSYQGKPVFIPLAARGDTVRFCIAEEKKNYVRGTLLEVINPGAGRNEAACARYCQCGGCQLQHLTTGEQLYFKQQRVVDALQRIGKLDEVTVPPVLAMENPWHYRHTMRLHAQHGPQGTVLGNYQPQSHTVSPLTACSLLSAELPAILGDLTSLLNTATPILKEATIGKGMPMALAERRGIHRDTRPADGSNGSLSAQHLSEVVIRQGRTTGDILLLLKATGSGRPVARAIFSELKTRHPNLVGVVVQDYNPTAGHGDRMTVAGQNFYTEVVSGIRFHIPVTVFFQNNPQQTEVLLQQVKAFCEPLSSEHLLDLYCGVGLFSHYLARHYKLVTGIEEDSTAVAAARENAQLNHNSNTVFISGRVEKTLARMVKNGPAPDTVILDPPRQGCMPEAIDGIAALSPAKIVYVSCNPSTLARDLALLAGQHYRIRTVQPIDMFPQTHHIECVAQIEKNLA